MFLGSYSKNVWTFELGERIFSLCMMSTNKVSIMGCIHTYFVISSDTWIFKNYRNTSDSFNSLSGPWTIISSMTCLKRMKIIVGCSENMSKIIQSPYLYKSGFFIFLTWSTGLLLLSKTKKKWISKLYSLIKNYNVSFSEQVKLALLYQNRIS